MSSHCTCIKPYKVVLVVNPDTCTIIEGDTRLVVPADSMKAPVPSRYPAFFNPRAARTRDLAVLACGAHMSTYDGRKTYIDAMAGVGARGIRVACEAGADKICLNDINGQAVGMAALSADMNGIADVQFSKKDACVFLSGHSMRGGRGCIVDIDPFGSPAPYLDCGIRATAHGGMLAVTATDLQVLGGLHNNACRRIYGGVPIRGLCIPETAIRLILGCTSSVAGRLGKGIWPLYAESHMHYYRVYVKILRRPGSKYTGLFCLCKSCGQRHGSYKAPPECGVCGGPVSSAGPLWIGSIFDEHFVQRMIQQNADGSYMDMLARCASEARIESPATVGFYTLDEIGAAIKDGPPRLCDMIDGLKENGHAASPTSFSPTGFRTDADMSAIYDTARSLKSHARQI